MTHQGLQEVRRSVAALRASPLEGKSLPAALSDLAAQSGGAGLTAQLTVSGEPQALSPEAALTLYRAAQEGLTNCRKHSGVTSARLVLEYLPSGRARMTVSDDGAGGEETAGGFGLLGVRERAQLLGGAVTVQTAPGEGFTLTIEVPA
jgi:signal transduction histidine kinase